jgi:nitrogen regulatory protein P-II 1
MELLVCVLNREEKLEGLLEKFVEIGITGATVIQSRGMGRVLTQEVPAFGALKDIDSHTRDKNVTVFSVVHDPDRLKRALKAIEDICGDLNTASTGIAFTVPVSSFMGLSSMDATTPEQNSGGIE